MGVSYCEKSTLVQDSKDWFIDSFVRWRHPQACLHSLSLSFLPFLFAFAWSVQYYCDSSSSLGAQFSIRSPESKTLRILTLSSCLLLQEPPKKSNPRWYRQTAMGPMGMMMDRLIPRYSSMAKAIPLSELRMWFSHQSLPWTIAFLSKRATPHSPRISEIFDRVPFLTVCWFGVYAGVLVEKTSRKAVQTCSRFIESLVDSDCRLFHGSRCRLDGSIHGWGKNGRCEFMMICWTFIR